MVTRKILGLPEVPPEDDMEGSDWEDEAYDEEPEDEEDEGGWGSRVPA